MWLKRIEVSVSREGLVLVGWNVSGLEIVGPARGGGFGTRALER